jgi:hypothetical protein
MFFLYLTLTKAVGLYSLQKTTNINTTCQIVPGVGTAIMQLIESH